MKTLGILLIGLWTLVGLTACSKWDDHYGEKPIETEDGSIIEVSELTAMEYLQTHAEYSDLYNLYKENGLVSTLNEKNQFFTLLTCDNEALSTTEIEDVQFFINSSVCDICMSPVQMVEGASLKMWCGKYLRVTETETATQISEINIIKIVKTKDAYIYVMESPVIALKSLYETFEDLDDANYSRFKSIVRSYELSEFDKAASTPVGIDKTGNTIYDSVFTTRNTYLDWYNERGCTTMKWNMRSEAYISTMLIPSNDVIDECFQNAVDYQVNTIGREMTEEDTLKFNEWMIRACFYEGELTPEQLSAGGENLYAINAYHEYHPNWSKTYYDAVWNPNVQEVNTSKQVKLSNGVAYYIEKMKIPNYYIIWRFKEIVYDVYAQSDEDQKLKYFSYENGEKVYEVNGAAPMGPYTGSRGGKSIVYPCNVYGNGKPFGLDLVDVSTKHASVTLTTAHLNRNDGKVYDLLVPPGKYTLRTGHYANKQTYTFDIYFADGVDAEFTKVNATTFSPTSCHFDRSGSSSHDVGAYLYDYDYINCGNLKNSSKYDLDCIARGTIKVTGTESKLIKIKLETNDITAKNSSKGFAFFCWVLVPTIENY